MASDSVSVLVQNKTKCKLEATINEDYFKSTVPPGDTVELHAPQGQFTVNVLEISEIENRAPAAGVLAGGLAYQYLTTTKAGESDEGKGSPGVDRKKDKETKETQDSRFSSIFGALAAGAAAYGAVKVFSWATKRTGSLVCRAKEKVLIIVVTETDDGSFCLRSKQGEQQVKLRAVCYPATWESQVEMVELKPVPPGSNEWKSIIDRIHKTLPSAEVRMLQRIQNQWLWEKYSSSKARMEEAKGKTNEKDLFHGSRSIPPDKIHRSEHGFDFRFSRKGMWGTGTYFAVNASYSDAYAYSAGKEKQILLARVLTGETYRCQPDGSLNKPPLKDLKTDSKSGTGTFTDERYDSVSGNTNGSDIYVIYDHEKAYPAYLVTYITH